MEEYKSEGPTRHEEVKENGVTPHQRGGVINTLYPPGPRGGAGARMKNHCRKFWWCDLLLTAIIVLVITLPVVYVAIPKKAQHDINASTLSVSSQEVTNPQQNSVQLKIDSVAHSSSSFHPTLEAFKAGFSLKDQPAFLFVDLPETKAESETPISINQTVQIANMDQFKEYNKVVIGSESFDVYVSGKTKVHQSGLKPISVDYNKKVTMKGLNKLQGLNITDIQILFGEGKTLPDGSNMIGNVIIPNPSVMNIDLGNVTMNLYVDGKSIGTSLLPNMQLKPGTNNCSMQSTVAQLDVVQMITTKYKDAILPITIQGNSSVIDGKHLEYFESAIQANNITVNLNVGPALAAIGLNVTSSST